MITRRKIIFGVGVCALIPAHALGQSRLPVQIGFLNAQSRERVEQDLISINQGMAALGWKAGIDYSIESRWADGVYDRLPALAKELADKKLRLVIASPSQAVAAGYRWTSGTELSRTRFSATDPSARCISPVRPCVPMTTRS